MADSSLGLARPFRAVAALKGTWGSSQLSPLGTLASTPWEAEASHLEEAKWEHLLHVQAQGTLQLEKAAREAVAAQQEGAFATLSLGLYDVEEASWGPRSPHQEEAGWEAMATP